jgi:hypothetical protein
MTQTFLAGAITAAYLVAALFFLRFWHRSADRLFLMFALAFGLFALHSGIGGLIGVTQDGLSLLFLLRLAGFCLIIWAIVQKNRGRG